MRKVSCWIERFSAQKKERWHRDCRRLSLKGFWKYLKVRMLRMLASYAYYTIVVWTSNKNISCRFAFAYIARVRVHSCICPVRILLTRNGIFFQHRFFCSPISEKFVNGIFTEQNCYLHWNFHFSFLAIIQAYTVNTRSVKTRHAHTNLKEDLLRTIAIKCFFFA